MRRLRLGLVALLCGLLPLLAWAAAAVETAGPVALPSLTARLTDLTGTLPVAQKVALEQQLAEFEGRKGAQLVVLILPSTGPESIEQFGTRLLEAWKIGRRGVDDGALLIVAKDDRKLRIEVGYGLEGALNDATAKRIIAEVIAPRFTAGDFAGGIQAGVDALIKVIDGEALPAVSPVRPLDGGGKTSLSDLPEGLFIGILIALVIGGRVLRQLLGNLLGCGVAGGLTAFLGWLLVGGLLGIIGGAVAGIFLSLFGLDLLLSGLLRGGRGGGFGGGGGLGGGGGASGSW